MPYYTLPYPLPDPTPYITLPNDIKDTTRNPFVEPVLEDDSFFIGKTSEPNTRSLDAPSKLPDGNPQNYKRQYYKNLFSATTTAGYTEMQQVRFVRHTGAITGYQIGLPLR